MVTYLKLKFTQNCNYIYFPSAYLKTLKYKPKESVYARFFISQLVEKYFWLKNFLPKVDKNWVPVFENNIFWSISHKKDLVFVGVSDRKIGLDIEFIKIRDKSLLDLFSDAEYKILGWKNWDNFYVLWTGKEAIIKKNLWKLDDMHNLVLEKIEDLKTNIWWILFNKKLIISWNTVYNLVDWNIVLSISL